MKEKKFAIFYLKEGRLIAVDAVNAAAEYAAGKKLTAARARVDPALLADAGVSMKEILDQALS